MRRAYPIILLALVSLAAGCYETPKPNCAFLCGAAEACPDEYMCGSDNRCHLVTAGGGLAMCEEPTPPDAQVNDAPIDVAVADGGPDASIDSGAAVTTHTGLVSVQDVSVQGHPELGHGGQITISFTPTAGGHDFDNRTGTGEGCVADVYDLGAGEAPPIGNDEGTITLTGATATIPPCDFYMGVGYLCIAGGGTGGTGDSIVNDPAGPGTAGIVDSAPSGYTFSNADVGRYISITGGGAGNDGQFPIVGVNPGTNTVIYGNPTAVADATFTGMYTVVAGVGPVPGAPPPEFLADSDTVNAVLDPTSAGSDGDFEAFDLNVGAGDSFNLDTASQTAITTVSFTGGTLTLACAGGACGSAALSAIAIESTDGVIPGGAPDYFMPAPTGRVAIIQCAFLATSVTVAPEAMAILDMANPTRVQTTFIRANPGFHANIDGTNQVTVIAGHGIVGFSSVPPGTPDAGIIDAAVPIDADLTPDAGPIDADLTPDASPPDAFVCSPDLAPASDGSSAARQALMMSEINPGDYIELYNNTAAAIDLGTVSYQFCSPFNYCALASLAPGVTVPAHGYATVPWPSPTMGCFSTWSDNDAGGEVILFLDGTFSVDANIMDFVCWGTGHPAASRKLQAEATGKWTGPCDSAITGGSIHRNIGSDGISAADYNTSSPPSPMNCTP